MFSIQFNSICSPLYKFNLNYRLFNIRISMVKSNKKSNLIDNKIMEKQNEKLIEITINASITNLILNFI